MEIEEKQNKLLQIKSSIHTVCSYLDVKSLVTLRQTCSDIKNLVDRRIAKLLLRNKNYSGISYSVKNFKLPFKSENYMKLYSELSNSEIRSEINPKKLKCSYASSIDYSQTPENLLDGKDNTFWGSKGHDTSDASEYINFCHEDGLLLDIKKIEIGFYRENSFEPEFSFFPSNEIIVRVGLFEHKFDHEYGPFKVENMEDDKFTIMLSENNFLAKYFQIEFKGKPGLQKQDNEFYHAVGSMKVSGQEFDIEKGAGEILGVMEAYYQKQDFIQNTVAEFYKTTFPSLYSETIEENLKKLDLRHFILGNGTELIQKLHKPTIEYMMDKGYELDVVFEYINKSMRVKNDWECMSFMKEGELLRKYIDWVMPRYGILYQAESRLMIYSYFYKPFYEEFGEERGVDKDRFNQTVIFFTHFFEIFSIFF